ncbi:hypothetical protein N7474_003122 [Penicillium riverlandense]|uniref:uncharacterized protein n=1 Tax=Penicillium riverlandense TaxID=1903569 RepID=UPI002548008C|nr:uncharacterized protein N7474_003122 [Penicillium riverlandense]KAJ5825984.1 hypothetical protein N7474_003122 [Penicillium riverlandense]
MFGQADRPDLPTTQSEPRFPPRHPVSYSVAAPSGRGSSKDNTSWGIRLNKKHQRGRGVLHPQPHTTYAPLHAQSFSPLPSPTTAPLDRKPLPAAPNQRLLSPPTAEDPAFAAPVAPPYTPLPAISPVPAPAPRSPDESGEESDGYGFPPCANDDPNADQPTASALGHGTPSDWEHLGSPAQEEFDDRPWFPPRSGLETPTGSQDTVLTPPGYSTGLPGTGRHSVIPVPHVLRKDSFRSPISEMDSISQHHFSYSPVSPATVNSKQESSFPPVPSIRINTSAPSSHSPEPSISTDRGRSKSIDGIIEAWIQPITAIAEFPNPDSASLRQQEDQLTPVNERSPVELPAETRESEEDPPFFEKNVQADLEITQLIEEQSNAALVKDIDPHKDLDPWLRSSLTRYVAMLHKEATADSDQERFDIFAAFMAKETKLREILYSIDNVPQAGPMVPQLTVRSQTLPPTTDPKFGSVQWRDPVSPTAAEDDEYDPEGEESEYSSGGRPILAKRARHTSNAVVRVSSIVADREPRNTSRRSSSVPASLDGLRAELGFSPLVTNPPQPIYTPYRYIEGPQRGSDNLTFDRPAYQGYNDQWRQSAMGGRVMSVSGHTRGRSQSLASPEELRRQEEDFLGAIRQRSSAYHTLSRPTPTSPTHLPESLHRGWPQNPIEDLRYMVWAPMDRQAESSWYITTKEELNAIPDDFTYIQKIIQTWESSSLARRKRLDRKRMKRQDRAQRHVDSLLNKKVIGHADINTREEDFRQGEARVQLDEERREVDSFIGEVFKPLDNRLQTEISVLRKSYDAALNQLDREQKGKAVAHEQCSPFGTIKMVNEIHNKLEIRFQKRLELALDCERRRKKAERRPLVVIGDTFGLRQLDGDFDQMEKRNILEAARDRDDRANRLMDSFDGAILHGLGMNQSLLDALAAKAAQLDFATLRSSSELPDSEVEQILKSVAKFAARLRADSEEILHKFGDAGMALNDADYDVSVAEAWYANSDPDVFQRLDAEKQKEDRKIQNDTRARLESIRKCPAQIETTIVHLLQSLGETSAAPAEEVNVNRQGSSSPLQLSLDHQDRLRKALPNAKRRNAARHNT